MRGHHHFRTLLTVMTLLAVVSPTLAQEAAQDRTLTQKIYAVADLIVPIDMDMTKPAPPKQATKQDELIRLIQIHIAPGSWSERGGRISYYPQTMSLIVTHTPAVQAEIHKLLTRMRREMDKEVAVELRFVTLSDAALESLTQELAKHFPKAAATPSEGRTPTAWPLARSLRLDDKQVLWLLETAQGDRRTTVTQAPKVTMFNGQKATLTVADRQSFVTGYVPQGDRSTIVPKTTEVMVGHQHTLQPVIEADGKTVRLAVKLVISSLTGPVPVFPIAFETTDAAGKKSVITKFAQQPNVASMELETTLKIPDQHTQLAFLGSTLGETLIEYGPPAVVSRIPYVQRLFRSVSYGREMQHVLVLITPRIVMAEQETAAK